MNLRVSTHKSVLHISPHLAGQKRRCGWATFSGVWPDKHGQLELGTQMTSTCFREWVTYPLRAAAAQGTLGVVSLLIVYAGDGYQGRFGECKQMEGRWRMKSKRISQIHWESSSSIYLRLLIIAPLLPIIEHRAVIVLLTTPIHMLVRSIEKIQIVRPLASPRCGSPLLSTAEPLHSFTTSTELGSCESQCAA